MRESGAGGCNSNLINYNIWYIDAAYTVKKQIKSGVSLKHCIHCVYYGIGTLYQ